MARPLKSPTEIGEYRPRYRWLLLAAGLVFLLLIGRLAQLQLTQGQEYEELSRRNFLRQVEIPATRGMILDRKGRVLVDSRPSYEVLATPAFVSDAAALMERLGRILELDAAERSRLVAKINSARGLLRFRPVLVTADLQPEQMARLEARRMELDGVEILPRPRRDYPLGTFAAHLLGTLGEIGPAELEAAAAELEYEQGDLLGRRGVERAYEVDLRGRDGFERVVADSRGRRQPDSLAAELLPDRGARLKPAQPGHNLVLTMDADLQSEAEDAFGDQRAGALVALEVKTGRVRAYLSRPAIDPNDFAGGIAKARWRGYRRNRLKPLLDRASGGTFFPGSTFKLVTAVAGLAEGVITPTERITCPGYYRLGNRTFRCWRASGHGPVAAVKGIQQSCDVYFYRVGERLGPDLIAKWAMALGLGRPTGLPFKSEAAGMVPTRAWHRKVHKQKWQGGDTLSTAIGQGDNKVTALQLARAYAVVANGGRVFHPTLVERVETAHGEVVREVMPRLEKQIELPERVRQIVIEGLTAVVNEPGGTAYYRRIRNVDYKAAGKTGTAQVIRLGEDRQHDLEEVVWWHRDHALFAAFAPVADPEIAVAAIVEHGGHGSSAAAPLVMRVIKKWMEIEHPELSGKGEG